MLLLVAGCAERGSGPERFDMRMNGAYTAFGGAVLRR